MVSGFDGVTMCSPLAVRVKQLHLCRTTLLNHSQSTLLVFALDGEEIMQEFMNIKTKLKKFSGVQQEVGLLRHLKTTQLAELPFGLPPVVAQFLKVLSSVAKTMEKDCSLDVHNMKVLCCQVRKIPEIMTKTNFKTRRAC